MTLLAIATGAQITFCLSLVHLHPIFMLIIIFGVIYPLFSIASEFERDILPMLESDDEYVRGIAIVYALLLELYLRVIDAVLNGL